MYQAGPTHEESLDRRTAIAHGPWATHAALLVVQLAFGSQAVEGKLAMMPRAAGGAGLAPEAIAMARMIGAALFFQLLEGAARARGRSRAPSLTRRDHVWLCVLSLLGIAINQTLFLLGLRLTTSLSASLLSVTIPVFTALIAVLARQERPSVRVGVGLALALGGALELTGVRSVDHGAALVLVNSLSYALYLVLGRSVIQRLGALTVIRWIFTWGALVFAPFGLAPMLAAFRDMTPLGAGLLAYIVAVPTIVAYLANAWALGRSSATLVTIYIYLQPLIAAALAYVQFGQPVAASVAIAGMMILAGVTVVASRAMR